MSRIGENGMETEWLGQWMENGQASGWRMEVEGSVYLLMDFECIAVFDEPLKRF